MNSQMPNSAMMGLKQFAKAIPAKAKREEEEITSELGEGGREGRARGRCVANGFTNVVSPKG